MAIRNLYRRKTPSSPEVRGLFFEKAQVAPAFFNPSHSIGDRSMNATSVVQRQEGAITSAKPEEEPPVQKQSMEEDKPVQKQAKEEEPIQKQSMEEDKPVQAKEDAHPPIGISEGQQQQQTTSLPDGLKTRIETLSGIPMNDAKVHYNSPKPSQMKALAYTQGTDIYLAPGEEKHLPHEAWHVVQQKQGRVMPTLQAKGVGINDDSGLEQEATVMGHKATEDPTSA